MHKRQVTMIIGIMVVAAVVAIFAIVFNSSSHQGEEAVAATSSEHVETTVKKDRTNKSDKKSTKSTTDMDKISSTTKDGQTLDIKALLKDQIDAPKIASIKQDNKTIQVVFKDDGTKALDEFMAAYAKATVAIVKAAAKNGSESVTTARQVKLEDGSEYAVAAKWDKNQLANGIKLSDDAAIKDVLLSADHYAIGGAAWDAFTQRQKNDYKNNQQGGLGKTTDDAFNKWVQSGIVKN